MWSRAAAGLVAGFFLAAAFIALASWLLPGPWQSTIVAGMIAFIPAWIGAAALAFAFRSGTRAWCWMGALSIAGFALLWMLQAVAWVH